MTFSLEYHKLVERSIPATVALFGLLALGVCVPGTQAQIHGAPASVTSPGFGGRAINGTPASVTSLGRNGYSWPGVTFSAPVPPSWSSNGHHHSGKGTHHGNFYPYGYGYGEVYAVPVPVPVPYAADDNSADVEDNGQEYQGGPTIFDRRGPGASSYEPSDPDAITQPSSPPADITEPETPQDPTTLVFKDGHETEVLNYAIVGQTLYDLTPGHRRKIALADLDLAATQRANDSSGVTFLLPSPAQAN
ncbi:MAG TPA: hypothetical protein VMU61_01660 [Candidatus Aquilonibacter sp.]|nr:hypothetical protein [Candidatus Aquilonibacter sp.]